MLKVGLIGLGFISHEHVLGYLDCADAEIVAVCDLDRQQAQRWLEKWDLPAARCYTDYEEMLAAEDLDIVEILTPHYLHGHHAAACAQSGVRGISLQKPMAVGLRQCDRIIDACRAGDVVLKVYENYVFYPVYQQAKAMIDDGLIGDLMSLRIHTMAGLKEGASWPRFWLPGSSLLDVKKCQNSPLVADDGLHKFCLACWFMEREIDSIGAWIDESTPLDAPAYIRAKFKGSPTGGARYAQLDFTFSTKLAIPSDFWLDDFVEICGEKGVMWINQCAAAGDRRLFEGCGMSESPLFPPIVVFVDGKVTPYLTDMSLSERNWSTSFVGSTKHFIGVMTDGGEPILSGREGKNMIRYALAALLSAQEKRDIRLDEITSEAEAAGDLPLKTNFCNL